MSVYTQQSVLAQGLTHIGVYGTLCTAFNFKTYENGTLWYVSTLDQAQQSHLIPLINLQPMSEHNPRPVPDTLKSVPQNGNFLSINGYYLLQTATFSK